MEKTELYELRDIVKVYQTSKVKTVALRGVTTKIHKGEICLVMGPSGSGKSTLFNILGLLDSPTAGDLIIEGENSKEWIKRDFMEYRRDHIGFIFQNSNLFPNLNVYQNLMISMHHLDAPFEEKERSIEYYLKRVGLEEKKDSMPDELSGGQKQRVAIISALIKKPTVIIADEPTAELDMQKKKEVIELLLELQKDNEDISILIASHDDFFKNKVDRMLYIQDGLLVKDGAITREERAERDENADTRDVPVILMKINDIIACPRCHSKSIKKFFDDSDKNVRVEKMNAIGIGTVYCEECNFNETKEYIFYQIKRSD
ncbi:MAG: ABC transporter ATP-binding protein [Promethearchaeota archaeon]